MGMGRTRSRDADLKNYPGLNRKGGAYYIGRKWLPVGSDKAEAIRRWHQLKGAEDVSRTVSSLHAAYFAQEKIKALAANTRRNYERWGRTILKYFGEGPADQVTTSHIQQFLDLHPHKQEARNTVGLFNRMMKKAVQWGWRKENPCREVEKPKGSRRTRYWSDAEYVAIRAVVASPHDIAMDLAYEFSLAVGEVVSIKLADIGAGKMRVFRSKTKKVIEFDLTPKAEEIIARARALRRPVRSLYLFTNRRGMPYREKTVSRAISKAAGRIGIEDARFHDIRAKSASDEQETAQGRLGHESPETTRIYLRKPLPVSPIRRKL